MDDQHANDVGARDYRRPECDWEDYEPEDAEVRRVWVRLSAETRRSRFDDALRRLAALREVMGRPEDESERRAIERVVTWAHRSSFRRWQTRYRTHGFDGLISRRIGPPTPMPPQVRTAICTLRQVDPDINAEDIVVHVRKFHGFETSTTKVKRVLKEAGLSGRPGPRRGRAGVGERRLELGGMKLVEAAAEATGYVKELTVAIQEHVVGLERPDPSRPPDRDDRDEYGRFLPSYNERLRKGPGDEMGPGFASVSLKREGMNPERLQVSQMRPEIIERRVYGLLVSPLLGSGRWDGIRVPRGELLGELCGFAYMPATLDKFTRELKYAGVASRLWEVHGGLWLAQTRAWGDERRAVVAYVDGTTKPIWTRLFSQSTKVSCVGRTMPGLEQVAFHSGYGVPLWMVTHSGRAALVKVVPKMLNRLEEMWGSSSVGRIVVIDAEGNSVPFLKGLEDGKPGRAWVTRLRPSWMKGKHIFNRTNYRAYRDGDRVRVGVADFNDPDVKGGTFRMRVVEVERRTKGKVTYLGASTKLDEREWKAGDLADLYFDRWPAQELNFRAINQAVGLKQVHGYGKQLVDNVSVVTELDELAGKIRGAEQRLERQQTDVEECARRLREEEKLLARRQRRQATVHRHVEPRLVPGRSVTKKTQELVEEQRDLAIEVAERTEEVAKRTKRLDKANGRLERTEEKLATYRGRQQVLESRRNVFAHDVELDSLFSLLKVGLVLLVTYVLKELLNDARMDVSTFLDRVATLPARLRTTPELEILTFQYNRRDPEVMGLLASCRFHQRPRTANAQRPPAPGSCGPGSQAAPSTATQLADRFRRSVPQIAAESPVRSIPPRASKT
ncbi:MAG: hypothetical protein J7M25_13085 [Deltaproteobacteria bacterium]|nr:hypothetical protein [Deltaproteobacteria bacterium]